MVELIEITQNQAINIMEDTFSILKKCYGSDTFSLLSYDLGNNVSNGNIRLNRTDGIKIIKNSKTFVLNKECEKEDEVSTLSMYTNKQEDIFNILPVGIKYDMIIIKDS